MISPFGKEIGMSVKDKVVLVTGAARGIGRAVSERLLAVGAKVIGADIDVSGIYVDSKGSSAAVKCDVSRPEDVAAAVESALATFGRIDGLVNNAGIIKAGDFLDYLLDDFDRVLGINLRGSFMMGQAVARQMVKQVTAGGAPGAIVNMSSINSVVAIPNQTGYCVSKGGLAQLNRVMALAPHGIRVNAVGPGSIMTDILASTMKDPSVKNKILIRTPIGRVGEADEVASVVEFLLSEASSYVTGETIFCDGGRLAQNYALTLPQ
jgi:NAD(P)-dependent dehydrogenase (short-subunit alcohol dehydrogenase family)